LAETRLANRTATAEAVEATRAERAYNLSLTAESRGMTATYRAENYTPLPRVPTRVRVENPTSRSAPTTSTSNVCPAGAMAICNDGWVSYSQTRRGTCSWHNGVKIWCR
jgi:hypothetical protein